PGALLREFADDLEPQRLRELAQLGQRCIELGIAHAGPLHGRHDGARPLLAGFLHHARSVSGQRLYWRPMKKLADIDPEGKRLPIKLDSTSNGEFAPVPLWPANREANRLAHESASAFSKKLGLSRRSFLLSSCGAAATLLSFNAANAAAGRVGGVLEVSKDAAPEAR